MQDAQSGSHEWNQWTGRITAALLSLLVLYTAWYLLKHSDFTNDDIDSLVFMQHTGFWNFLLTPTDVHYVPLHQFLSWVVYHVAPMNFAVAVAVLLIFHVGTLIYLSATLKLTGAHNVSGLVVCAYAASGLIIVGFIWWAHAEHRVPYVFLDVCAIYHYLAWLKQGHRRHLFIAAVAFLVAFGFYEKAVLIPMHMFVFGYLSNEDTFHKQLRKVAWPPVLFALASFSFIAAYLHFLPASVRTSVPLALRADLEFVKVLLAGASGLASDGANDIPSYGLSVRLLLLLLTACAMLAFSLWRKQGSWKILVGMGIVLTLDYLPIAFSNRIGSHGLSFPHQYRFHYEELQLVALFMGMWCARVAARTVTGRRQQLAWVAGFLLVLVYMGINVVNVRRTRNEVFSWAWDLNYSHIYLTRLRNGLRPLGNSPVFENTRLPGYLAVFHLTPDTAGLIPLFRPDVRFSDLLTPRYKVLNSGEVVSIH